METIIIALIIGMIIGTRLNPEEKTKDIVGKLQHFGVVLLLFFMGAGLGLNKALLSNLKNIGLVGLTFAFMTTICSIVIVYLVTSFFERRSQ